MSIAPVLVRVGEAIALVLRPSYAWDWLDKIDDLRHWSDKLQTARLDLYALTPPALHAYQFSLEVLEADMGRRLSHRILTPVVGRATQMKLKKLAKADPRDWPWHTYWLAEIRESKFGAGLLGFKGPPDKQGRVEIGYDIDPEATGHGYTSEAAAGLIKWAFQHPNCRKILASETRKDNPASHRILSKLGMQAYDETKNTISYHLKRNTFSSG